LCLEWPTDVFDVAGLGAVVWAQLMPAFGRLPLTPLTLLHAAVGATLYRPSSAARLTCLRAEVPLSDLTAFPAVRHLLRTHRRSLREVGTSLLTDMIGEAVAGELAEWLATASAAPAGTAAPPLLLPALRKLSWSGPVGAADMRAVVAARPALDHLDLGRATVPGCFDAARAAAGALPALATVQLAIELNTHSMLDADLQCLLGGRSLARLVLLAPNEEPVAQF